MVTSAHPSPNPLESKLKLTKNRRMVFEALSRLAKPVTAYQLLEILQKQTGQHIDPPTIYRALSFLQQNGMIMKIEGLNAFMTCKTGHHGNDHVLLICNSCGSADEHCGNRLASDLVKSASRSGFRPNRQIIELHGECQSCQD